MKHERNMKYFPFSQLASTINLLQSVTVEKIDKQTPHFPGTFISKKCEEFSLQQKK